MTTMDSYVPSSVLGILHNSPRFGGGNEIEALASVQGLDQDNLFATDGFLYIRGVTIGGVVMLVAFIISLIVLCCAGLCRRSCCGNRTAGVVFLVLMTLSCFGWFYSIAGSASTSTGTVTLLDGAAGVVDLLDRALTTVEDTNQLAVDINAASVTAQGLCKDLLALNDTTFPTTDFSGELGKVTEPLADVRDAISSADGEVKDAIDVVTPGLDTFKTSYVVTIVLVIVLTAIFTLSTLFRVFAEAPGRETPVATCLSKTSGCCFLSLGSILLLALWILIGVLSTVGHIGSDICVPSPSSNLNNILAPALDMAAGEDVCAHPEYQYVCFYQTCAVGPDANLDTSPLRPLLEEPIAAAANLTQLTQALLVEVNAIIAELEKEGLEVPPEADQCLISIETLNTELTKVDEQLLELLGIADCRNVGPLYRSVTEDGFCEGVIGGVGVMYITMALGATALMAGMIVFRCFQFDRYEYGELMAMYATELQPVGGVQPVGTGAPIQGGPVYASPVKYEDA